MTLRLLVGLFVVAGAAQAFDLSLTFMRDVLYQPERDSAVQPAAAAVGVGFRFGSIGMVQARVGGSGYWYLVMDEDVQGGSHARDALKSVWVQAIPGVRVPLFRQYLSVIGGIGLGGRSSAERRIDNTSSSYDYQDWHERSVWAFDQTFVLGLEFELSSRLGLDLEATRAGFTAGRESRRYYRTYLDYADPIEETYQDFFQAGWRRTAATGLGVGLHVKL